MTLPEGRKPITGEELSRLVGRMQGMALVNERVTELEGKLETAMEGLKQCEAEIDNYIRHEYPGDHPVQARYRKRDFDANPARITLAEMKGQDDE